MTSRKKNPSLGSDVRDWISEELDKDPVLAELVAQDLRELNLSKKLKERRKELGISQTDLARLVRTKQPAISRIESGRHDNIQIATLSRVARTLGFKMEISLKRSTSNITSGIQTASRKATVGGARTRRKK